MSQNACKWKHFLVTWPSIDLWSEPKYTAKSKQPKIRKIKMKENNHRAEHLLTNVNPNKRTLRCVLDTAKSEHWRAANGWKVSKGKVFIKEAVFASLADSTPDTKNNMLAHFFLLEFKRGYTRILNGCFPVS